jgi:hypothetical protein
MSPLESTAATALTSPIKTRSPPADDSVNADRKAHPRYLSASSLLVRAASSVRNDGCMEELREENSPGFSQSSVEGARPVSLSFRDPIEFLRLVIRPASRIL